MNRHRDPTFATAFPEVGKWPIHVQVSHYATVACKRLERIGSNGKKQAKKPTEDEIEQSRVNFNRKINQLIYIFINLCTSFFRSKLFVKVCSETH